MKISYYLSILLIFSLLSGCKTDRTTDDDSVVEHRRSPIVITSVSHGDTYIKVVYGQPYKRGREIFGGLEPYGEIWRTGANEATEITVTGDIVMAGHPVAAGTYSLFTIPEPDEWTVILNSELGQWGAFTYNPDFDYLRFQVPVHRPDQIVEAFTITFDDVENDQTTLILAWDDSRIEIPVTFNGL